MWITLTIYHDKYNNVKSDFREFYPLKINNFLSSLKRSLINLDKYIFLYSFLFIQRKMENNKYNSNYESCFKLILRALYSRNYRLFFIGQGISLIGTFMQQVAISWLIYRLTGSAMLLGVVGFLSQIPVFFITPFAGVFIDRWHRQQLLIITQILFMLQALVLAFFTITHSITIWHIIILGTLAGFVSAFDMPARQTFVVEMVDKKEDLGNAIALNSFLLHSARLVGPSLAGILIGITGEGICFLINGISYLAAILSLLAMTVNPKELENLNSNILKDLKDGLNYAFGFLPIKYILLFAGINSLMGMPYGVLMPIFAKKILHGGPQTLGFLIGASGVGALIGAIYLASRKSILGLCKIMATASSIFGIGIITFSLSRLYSLSLLLMLCVGFGMMVVLTSSNTVLQTIIDDNKRGRVMGLFTMMLFGMFPFGSLLSGTMASKIGAPNTLILSGVFCILSSMVFASKLPLLQKIIKPIYIEKGILEGELI